MPIHDWSRAASGLFHDFHQSWSIRVKDALNGGVLPSGTVALVEQRTGPRESDVLAVEAGPESLQLSEDAKSGVALVEPITTQVVRRSEKEFYAGLANRIVVRHHLGRVLAVIEIVSPGNKDSKRSFREFIEKTVQFLEQGIHVLIIDLFPPTPRDPSGIHKAIWDEFEERPYEFPAGKDRTLVSYKMGDEQTAYIEPIAVGDSLPEMPLFLTAEKPPGFHVSVPLESTYQATWNATPREVQAAILSTGG